jgi:hypothetical protein
VAAKVNLAGRASRVETSRSDERDRRTARSDDTSDNIDACTGRGVRADRLASRPLDRRDYGATAARQGIHAIRDRG